MKIIFIAGPYYSGGDRKKIKSNINNAEKCQIALANTGIGFFCAHNHTRHFELKAKAPESFYKELDMVFLTRVADAVLAMPGWKNSDGARQEVSVAIKRWIRVFYLESLRGSDIQKVVEEIKEWMKSS